MAFTPVLPSEVTEGSSIQATTVTKLKDNFDNHESRVEALEAANLGDPPIILRVSGGYPVANAVLRTTMKVNLTISGARILVDRAGTANDLEIDLQYKRGTGAFTSVFTTKPKVNYAAGDDALSNNGVLNLSQAQLQAGDILRLDITGAQIGASGFLVRIDYVRT